MENNEIVKRDEEVNIVANASKTYCSFKPKNTEERKMLFNTLEKCDAKLNDIVGQTIKIKNVIINEYPRKDAETGEEMSNGHRTIIIDDENKSYVTASNYFFVALAKLLNTFGNPDTWEEPMEIKIVKKAVKNGNQALGFELV